jgi:hypothetical protein
MSWLPALRKRQRIDGIADYHSGEPFQPGIGILVYDPDFQLPKQGLIGAATHCGNAPSPFGAPPIYVPQPQGLVRGMQVSLGDFESTGLMGG